MPRKKKVNTVIPSPAMLSLVHQIGKTKKELAKLKNDLKKISDSRKRKTGKNKKPLSFSETMKKYAALERRALRITQGILKKGNQAKI